MAILLSATVAALAGMFAVPASATGTRAGDVAPLDVKAAADVYRFSNAYSSRCLEAGGFVDAPDAAYLWTCDGSTGQGWYLEPTAEAGQYQLRNYYSGKCLDADAGTIGANGTIVQQWDCLGNANQTWVMKFSIPNDTNSPARIINVAGNRCLDAEWETIGVDGTNVQLWDCLDTATQIWN